jgi:aspartate kinase
LLVYKFGGALARSKRGLEALVKILNEAYKLEATRARRSKKSGVTYGIVLVTSAIGHTTRHLALAAELAEDGWLPEAEESLSRTIAQHQQLAASLALDDEAALLDRFEAISADIAALLEGVAILRELSPRTRDAILASGEKLAVVLIEALLRDREFPVRAVDASDVIITDEQFGHASPLREEIASRAEKLIVPQLRRGHIVLVQGFAGATLDGITTTMGSESSDLTATLLAAALGAKEIVIWKTLPGLYTADPEFVKTPKLIRSMSFDEAEEMGRRGARILFPSFAHPLATSDAVLRIATPFSHTKGHTVLERETSMSNHAPSSRRSQKPLTIALEQHLLLLTMPRSGLAAINSSKMSQLSRRREQRMQEALRQSVLLWASPEQISALIRKSDRRAILRELAGSDFTEGETLAAISLIVRKNGKDDPALLGAIARSLRPFAVHAILPSGRSIIALVADAEALPALRKLHHDLFEV